MVNIQWKDNEKTRYENLLSDKFVEDFVNGLKSRGCVDIVVTNDIEEEVKQLIGAYNSPVKR